MSGSFTYLPPVLFEKTGFQAVLNAVSRHLYTPNGSELLRQLQPAAGKEELERLLDRTRQMLLLLEKNTPLPFVALEEIRPLLQRAAPVGSMLPAESFRLIRQHAESARIIRSFLAGLREEIPALWEIAGELEKAEELEKGIARIFDDQGTIRNDATPQLRQIRSELGRLRETLRRVIEKVYRRASREGHASDEGPTLRNGRMVIPVLASHKRKIDGFVQDVSATGQTVWLEPAEALAVNNDIRQMELNEQREVERILRQLTDLVREERMKLLKNGEILGELDLIQAKVRLGHSWEGVVPEISSAGWNIVRGRNPNLLLRNRRRPAEEKEEVVPLDFELLPQEKGVIISGPNAGGKSVALKTIGIFPLLFQTGIPLPASDGTRLPLLSGISLDMGDEQSIENDLSTFSSRLQWMRQTLEQMDAGTLVLIDEAGTGTDPDEGSALFQAFIESILERGATVVATTHHGNLKLFAHQHPLLTNGAMEFDQQTLSPAYRFRKGMPGSSYAFEIAARMALPAPLLRRARTLLGDQKDRMAELLLSLEQQLQEAREAAIRHEEAARKAREREEEYRIRAEQLEQQKKRIVDDAWREADRIMQEANRKIERAVEEIYAAGKSGEVAAADRDRIRQARREVAEHRKRVRSKATASETPPKPKGEPPGVGDSVRLEDGTTVGELIEVNGNQAVVLVGGMKIRTAYDRLARAERRKEERGRKKAVSYRSDWTMAPAGFRIDLRGQRAEEAIRELTLFLDRAVTGGLRQVEIIHGKGEGILMEHVHRHLAGRQEITHFELAPLEQGGAGCTLAWLK